MNDCSRWTVWDEIQQFRGCFSSFIWRIWGSCGICACLLVWLFCYIRIVIFSIKFCCYLTGCCWQGSFLRTWPCFLGEATHESSLGKLFLDERRLTLLLHLWSSKYWSAWSSSMHACRISNIYLFKLLVILNFLHEILCYFMVIGRGGVTPLYIDKFVIW